jgi:hypothetical protein
MKSDLVKSILAGVAIAILMTCVLAGLVLAFRQRPLFNSLASEALITKLAISTVTPTQQTPTQITDETTITKNGDITIGVYVQISGTGNIGLRIRLSPGVSSTLQFVAMENEVFYVKDGPIVMDDITWWLLVASYDENRQGWAAGQYLTVINQP